MTIEETEEFIKIMQHFVNGGEIECYWPYFGWLPENNPAWNWNYFKYRKKRQTQPIKVTEEEMKIINNSPIFWAKGKVTGQVDFFLSHLKDSFLKDYYILNPDTKEWEDWSQK